MISKDKFRINEILENMGYRNSSIRVYNSSEQCWVSFRFISKTKVGVTYERIYITPYISNFVNGSWVMENLESLTAGFPGCILMNINEFVILL